MAMIGSSGAPTELETSWDLDDLPPLAQDIGLPPGAVLIVPANGQELYRLLRRPVARERDFMSHFERSLNVPEGATPPVPREPDDPMLDWMGISMFATEDQAAGQAAAPTFVQRVHLAPGQGFSLARVEAEIEGHYNVWGGSEALLDGASEAARPRNVESA